MAGPLAAVERFFERLFERPAARLFQARVEPIQIQRSLERAMESERVVHARRAYAPSEFRVLMSSSDLAALDGDRGEMANELAESLRNYARTRNYTLLARPRIEIEASSVIAQGDMRVFAEQPAVPDANGATPLSGIREPNGSSQPRQTSSPFSNAVPEPLPGSQATAVFAAHQLSLPKAVLVIHIPRKPPSRLEVSAGTLRMGRSSDNEVVIDDDRVSRRHGRLAVRQGMLVYTDLGSTNGSYLNGTAVTEIALGPGDVLQVGSSTITIEPAH
ncbi:MAG: DUF3662 and FHA domain-containing protein [Candidatus Limnocylindrales bacterium]